MEKLKVFFSYSQADGAAELIQQIKPALPTDLKTLVDFDYVLIGENVESQISRAIWESDLMVPILTARALNSHWVHSELVRAHERGVTIMPIVPQELVSKLPLFLRNTSRVEYSSPWEVTEAIRRKLEEWRRQVEADVSFRQKREIREHIGVLQRWIQNHCKADDGTELRPLQLTLADTVLKSASSEIKNIRDLKYRQSIGRERDFVVRATPVFECACEILATSLDTVSTFWENAELRNITREYIDAQSRQATYRLFVFSNADNAHKYGHLLAAHHRRYGETGGGVYICSLNAYRHKIVPKISRSSNADQLLRADFALLTYTRADATEEVLEATLDQDLFVVEQHGGAGGHIDAVAFRKLFEELQPLDQGAAHPTYDVYRWSPKFVSAKADDLEAWAAVLREMFGAKRYGDIYHMVFFSNLRAEDIRHVLDVKNRILELKEDLQRRDAEASPLDVWFGSRIAVAATDSLGAGRIDVGSEEEAPYVLTMKFSSREGLKKYYEDHEHSDARRTLYESLRPETIPLFKLIEKYPGEVRDAVWDVINRIGKDWIERRDYIDNEEFRYLVQKPVPPFNY